MTSAPASPSPARPVRRWPYVLPLVVLALLFAIFGKRLVDVEHGADPNLIPSVLLDTPVPSFDLPALPGRTESANLTSDSLKGQVTLLNVWGSWCIACLEEHPTLVELARQGGVPINGIDWRDTPERASAWLAKNGDPYARIGQDPDSHTAIALGVTGAPETFVIDRAGVIRYKQIGPITPEVWQRTIAPLIAKLRQ